MSFNRNTVFSCCRNCVPPDRSPGCHSSCTKYAKAKENLKTIRKQEQENKAYVLGPNEFNMLK